MNNNFTNPADQSWAALIIAQTKETDEFETLHVQKWELEGTEEE